VTTPIEPAETVNRRRQVIAAIGEGVQSGSLLVMAIAQAYAAYRLFTLVDSHVGADGDPLVLDSLSRLVVAWQHDQVSFDWFLVYAAAVWAGVCAIRNVWWFVAPWLDGPWSLIAARFERGTS
jgi:hypothetical protein